VAVVCESDDEAETGVRVLSLGNREVRKGGVLRIGLHNNDL
jgi:hypothetical protein